ncbi:MAG: hypothetical protein A2V79_01290 [Betaproteobacteria bacterium RBG_16_56_24]|nr:MAG: hypothetical protein A2V79_01290 [Betaproteobacteria bacterium RBG_16_56_24]
MKMKNKFAGIILALLTVGMLAGCGGGGGSSTPTASTLSGTAAVGYPIIGGTINVSCAAGSALNTTTNSSGGWQVTVSGQTPPCAVQVSSGTINGAANSTFYHSIASALGTVNITPLTDLMVANLAGAATTNTWFAGLNSTALNAITQTQIDAALTQLRTALALTPLNTINPITTAFTPTPGNTSDDILTALSAAMTSASVTYANLLSSASATTFTLPTGYGSALSTAYAGTTSGGGSQGSAPAIASFSPSSGAVGTTVTITGTNFDPDPFHMQVAFGSNVSATITSASSTQLVVTVPSGSSSGTIKVTNGLTNASVTSTANFTVTGNTGGSNWTQRSYGSSFMLNSVAYGNSTFVAVGFGNTIVTSNDGITWIKRNAPDANSYTLESVIWDGAQFVMVGDVIGYAPSGTSSLIATSPDGVTWSRRNWTMSGVAETWLADVTAGGNRLTAVGKNGAILSSTDNGATWGEQFKPSISGAYIAGFNGVASSASTRVAVGGDTAYKGFIIDSTDGVNWSVAQSALTTFYPQDVEWNGTLFIAVGATDANFGAKPVLMTSPDGVTWTTQTLPASIADSAGVLNHVTRDGTQYIAVGSNGGSGQVAGNRFILTSLDGVTWSLDKQWSTAGQINSLAGIAVSPTQAVTVGDSLWTKL